MAGANVDSRITQLKAQGPSRTCNESKEEGRKSRRGARWRWRGRTGTRDTLPFLPTFFGSPPPTPRPCHSQFTVCTNTSHIPQGRALAMAGASGDALSIPLPPPSSLPPLLPPSHPVLPSLSLTLPRAPAGARAGDGGGERGRVGLGLHPRRAPGLTLVLALCLSLALSLFSLSRSLSLFLSSRSLSHSLSLVCSSRSLSRSLSLFLSSRSLTLFLSRCVPRRGPMGTRWTGTPSATSAR